MRSMYKRLADEGLLSRLVVDTAAQGLLTSLQIQDPEPAPSARELWTVVFGMVEQALGVLDLDLIAPGPNDPRQYVLTFEGPALARTGFRLAVSLHEGPQKPLFTFLPSLAGKVLTAAERVTGPDSEWLKPLNGVTTQLTGAGVWLVVEGQAGGAVSISLSPNSDPPDDVITLALDPIHALLGNSGFGLSIPNGVSFDFTDLAAVAGPTVVDGSALSTPADTPSWRGLVVRHARLFLPQGVPFMGGHAVDAHVQVGLAPTPGIDLVIHANVPPQGNRPGIGVRIECRDPSASGLSSFVPTLVEMVMELPLDGRQEAFGNTALKLAAGKPVRARVTYARKPAPPGTPDTAELSLAIESQGPRGLIDISSSDGNLGSKIAVTAGTLATALIANNPPPQPPPPGADASGEVLETLLLGAVGLSSFLEKGDLVLHRAEVITTGGVLPVGKKMRLKIDYSVAATVTGINVGVMSLQMQPNQPLRVRVREVIMTIDPEASGLKMVSLDYTRSSLEVEDPGGWQVAGPGSLFDVLGTRSGRGSMWIEVDLRFKLDLGPVKVSGLTIRATLDNDGNLSATPRGLEATIALAPMIDGDGAVTLTENGFRAALAAQIRPLEIGARADVETASDMVKLALGVDLPGPIPLGNTGLGIYGLGGIFAANGRPAPGPPGKDPVQHQLDWDYRRPGSFVSADAFSFGLEAVIGTAVDMGFTFSARAGLFITTPEFAVRGALNGRFMGPRVKITREEEGGPGIQGRGVVVVDPTDGVTVGVEGTYTIPEILLLVIPVGARFPRNSADWYIHLGADGWSPDPGGTSEGRERGPVRAVLLPNLIGQQADAYLMFRGNGITKWPRGGPVSIAPGNFIAAFGFGFNIVMGVRPIVWAEVFARADILVTTNPMYLVGLGQVGGGLHVGIFSVGVDASVNVVIMEGSPPYLFAEVCGTVDLLFDEVHKCVKLSFNSPPPAVLPPPAHPMDSARGQALVDDKYNVVAPLSTDREGAPTVWPDAIPLLTLTTAPKLSLPAGQFPDAAAYPEADRARPLGGDMLHYEWELTSLTLIDSTDPANELLVAGPMSCAWLDGKLGDAGGQAQPAELALLTPFGDLWLNALADAGTGLPHKPLDTRANICQARVAPRLGWAVGAAATKQGAGWRLPPDPLSVDPLQSQVRATVELYVPGAAAAGGSLLLDHTTAPFLPPPLGYSPPHVRGFAAAQLDDREFTAALIPGTTVNLPPDVRDMHRIRLVQELRIVADEPLAEARAWLAVARADWPNAAVGLIRIQLSDDLGQSWVLDLERDLGDGLVALRWRPPATTPVTVITVRVTAGIAAGIIAVGGITASAATAASARNAASQAEATKQKTAADDGPPKSDTPPTKTKRCVLKPGKVYRIDVEMQWSGEMTHADNKGNKSSAAKQAADGSTLTTRSYWFRTAKARDQPVSFSLGTVAYAEHLYKRLDLFDPDMLVRHLRGYQPAQSELHRFADDPVRVHFAYGHVAALARAYGFDLLCGLRRLDAPVEEEPDSFFAPQLLAPQTPAFITGPEKLIAEAYLESPCGLAPRGAVLHTPLQLTRNAWYEVFVRAKSLNPDLVADGRIPGVSFRTSRWGGGEEMLKGLRFPTSGLGKADGGVLLRPGAVLAPGVIHDDDGAFDATLAELGLDGWPAATEPRVSLLWREMGPEWRCAGVMIESPEPIHRPGRFHVDALYLRMGFGAIGFDLRMRDRSGSRLLFATSAPFAPRVTRRGWFLPPLPPALRLDCTELPIGQPAQSLRGWLEVPLRPSFAEEAA